MEDEGSDGVEDLEAKEGLPVISTTHDVRSGSSTTGLRRTSAPLRCKVSGCTSDLASAPKTHQRFRLCNLHIKAPVILVDGVASRFCQQCSRFHSVREFHGTNRTCRMMLVKNRARQRGGSGAASSPATAQKRSPTAVPLLYVAATTQLAPVLPPAPMLAVGCSTTTAVNAPATTVITAACSPDASLTVAVEHMPSGEPASPHAWQSEPGIANGDAETSATTRLQNNAATGCTTAAAVVENAVAGPASSATQDSPSLPHSTHAAAPRPSGAMPPEPEKQPALCPAAEGPPSPCRSQTPVLHQVQPCLAVRCGAAAAVEAAGVAFLPSMPHSPVGLAPDAVQKPIPRSASALAFSYGCTALIETVAAAPLSGKGVPVAGLQAPALADTGALVDDGAVPAALGGPAFPRTSSGCAADGDIFSAANSREPAWQGCAAAAAAPLGVTQFCAAGAAAAASGASASYGCPVSLPVAAGLRDVAAAARPSVPSPSPFARCSAPADLCHTAPGRGTLRDQLLEASAWPALLLEQQPKHRKFASSQSLQPLERLQVPQQQQQQCQQGQVVRSKDRPCLRRELSLQHASRCGRSTRSQLCDVPAAGSGRGVKGHGGDGGEGSGSQAGGDGGAGRCAEDGAVASGAANDTGGTRACAWKADAVVGGTAPPADDGAIFFRMSAPPEGAAAPELTCADLRSNSVSCLLGRTSAVGATAVGAGLGLLGQEEPAGRVQALLQRSGSSGSFKRRRSYASEVAAGDGVLSVRPCSSAGVEDLLQDPQLAASDAKLDLRPQEQEQPECRRQHHQTSPMDCDGPMGPYNMHELRTAAAAAAATGPVMLATDADSPDAMHVGRKANCAWAGGSSFGRVSAGSRSPLGRRKSLSMHRDAATAATADGANGGGGSSSSGGGGMPMPALEAPAVNRGLPCAVSKADHVLHLPCTAAATESDTGPAAASGVGAATDCDTLLLASLAAEWRCEDGPDCIDQLLLEGLEEAGAAGRASAADRLLSCMPQQSALARVPPAAAQSLRAQAAAQAGGVADAMEAAVPRTADICALSRSSWASRGLLSIPPGLDATAAAGSDTLRIATRAGSSNQSHAGNCSNDGVGIEKSTCRGTGARDAGWSQAGAAVWLRSAQSEPVWWTQADELQQSLPRPHPLLLQDDNQALLQAQLRQRQARPAAGLGVTSLGMAASDATVPAMATELRPGRDDAINTDGASHGHAPSIDIDAAAHDVARGASAAAAVAGRETVLETATDNPVVVRKAIGEETEEQLHLLLGDLIGEAPASSVRSTRQVLTPWDPTTRLTTRQLGAVVPPPRADPGRLSLKPQPENPSQLHALPSAGAACGEESVCCTLADGIGKGGAWTLGVQLSLGSWGVTGFEGPVTRDAAASGRTGAAVQQQQQRQEGAQPQQRGFEQVPGSAVGMVALERTRQSAPPALDTAQCHDGGVQPPLQQLQEQQARRQQQQQTSAAINGPHPGSGSGRGGGRRGGQQRSTSLAQTLPDREFLDLALRQQQALWSELRVMQEQQQTLLLQQIEQQRALARLLRVGPSSSSAVAAVSQAMNSSSSDRSNSEQPPPQPQQTQQAEGSSCGSTHLRPVPAFGRWSMPAIASTSDDSLQAQAQEDRVQEDSRQGPGRGLDDPFARRSQQPDTWHRPKRQHASSLLSEVSSAAPLRGLKPGSGGLNGDGLLDRSPVNGMGPSAADGSGPSLAHPRLAWVQQQL